MAIKDTFQTFIGAIKEKTGKTTDYIYTPQGDVNSRLINELVAEGIPYTNVNGYLLIPNNRKVIDRVRNINKEILTEQAMFYKETDTKELQSQLSASNMKGLDTYSMNNVSLLDYIGVKDSLIGIPQLMLCVGEQDNGTYKMTVPKDKMFSKDGKNLAQAYLESALKDNLSSSKTKITDFETKMKLINQILSMKTSAKDYHITSEVDPATFMTVTKDGFSLNHWQVTNEGVKRVTDQKHTIAEENYTEEFYRALDKFPDIKVAADNSELNDFLMRKHKPKISIKEIRKNRGTKRLAKLLNTMMLGAGENMTFTLNSYTQEAMRILKAANNGLNLTEYNQQDIEELRKIIARYGLEEEISKTPNEISNVPDCREETVTPMAEKERGERNYADTNREGAF